MVVLIYFIHHISDSIQIATLTGDVRRELCATIRRVYPDPEDADGARLRAQPGDDTAIDREEWAAAPVRARRSGYVQYVDEDVLVSHAARLDLLVALHVRVGQYVVEGSMLADVRPAERADERVLQTIVTSVHLADARTPHQDPEFAVQQLTDMAVRALSPGANDPFTAINALDGLSSGLCLLVTRSAAPAVRRDDAGVLRVRTPRVPPADLISAVIDRMRWYAASAPAVMRATLDLLDRVGALTTSAGDRAQLVSHVRLLEDAFASAGHHPHDVASFTDHARYVTACLLRREGQA